MAIYSRSYGYRSNQPWAYEALKRNDFKCQGCGVWDSEKPLVVHHLDESRKNGFKSMNNAPKNLMVLCRTCHYAIHHKKTTPRIDHFYDVYIPIKDGVSGIRVAKKFKVSTQRIYQIYKEMEAIYE